MLFKHVITAFDSNLNALAIEITTRNFRIFLQKSVFNTVSEFLFPHNNDAYIFTNAFEILHLFQNPPDLKRPFTAFPSKPTFIVA